MRLPEDIPADILEWGIKHFGEQWWESPTYVWDHSRDDINQLYTELDIVDESGRQTLGDEKADRRIQELMDEINELDSLSSFVRKLPTWNNGWPSDAEAGGSDEA